MTQVSDAPPWSFFLGGHDLEMVEIARLLASKPNVRVHDLKLSWGARASAYTPVIAEALGRGHRVALVELDDDLPPNFPRERITFIDHHAPLAFANTPTSLEQVFALLGCPPGEWNTDRKLVAANDRGHVAALVAAGALVEEIRDIRVRDRKAQGITAEEEKAGESAALAAERLHEGRLTVVRLPHDRSATVTDALDDRLGGPGYENLLVLGRTKTLFFGDGRGIDALRGRFPGGWFGGELPARGYWGIADTPPTPTLISILGEVLMSKPANQIVVTAFHHTLLWPLLLRGPGPDTDQSIEPFVTALINAGWSETASPSSTRVDDDFTYEEIVYFHPFVRDFLFGDGRTGAAERALRRFRRTDLKEMQAGLPGGPMIALAVKRAEAMLIRPRVLLLLLEVSNQTAEGQRVPLNLEQVLRLQNCVRRVYPAYFFSESVAGDVLASVHLVGSLAMSFSGSCTLGAPRTEFDEFVRTGAEPPMFAHWQALFGKDIQPLRSAADRLLSNQLFVQQIIDDRMPAMSYIAVEDPAQIGIDDADRLPAFDPPDLTYDKTFRDRQRDLFRYTRFSHYGTTYYCSGSAFSVVVASSAPDFLLEHFRRHYTRLGIITHYQHAALLYFEDELAECASQLAGRKTHEEFADTAWRHRVRNLLHRILKFRTRSYFTEVSNQIQGKELFRLWTNLLGTPELFQSVAETSDRIYQALEDYETRELSEAQSNLAKAAEWGLGLSIFFGAMAAVLACGQIFPRPVGQPGLGWGSWVFWMWLPIAFVVGAGSWWVYTLLARGGKNHPVSPNK